MPYYRISLCLSFSKPLMSKYNNNLQDLVAVLSKYHTEL